MVTIKRYAPALAALALVLSGCGDADGDLTSTDPGADADSTAPVTEQSPSSSPADPGESADRDETSPPAELPSGPPTDDPGSDDTGKPEPDPATEPATQLTVMVDPGAGEVVEWTISCDPAGGSIGDVEPACETLESIGPRDVAPVPRDAQCTMQYGGPQTARITGTWNGTKVDLAFSRQNGCEIGRWDKMDPVLPAGDGVLN